MMDAHKLLINLLYLAAAQSSEVPGWSHRETKKAIESAYSLEFWHVIEDHYLAKGWTRRDLEKHIKNLISDRYLRRGYAV
ncbi:TPA: hypothetical protein N1910_005871 [Pseudomonas aeruginosa C40A]|nr:hypothetical protein EGV95_24760 [Pseudomonas aeruginosa]SMZ52505.1 hypothetical protein PANN_46730 [Pseudomonas aeruginosa C-NN2]HCL2606956.1 hypothetical protein [Pseudomonas aeruginosa C40A]MDA3273509.1 hypothetical protein [Pseudomonas aeruginosa]MDV6846548.1 hypothetical protein [Pseudomonas aeruginosa]